MIAALLLLLGAVQDAGTVDTLPQLQARLDAAKPGDIVIVKDGIYTTAAPIVVKSRGTSDKPIRIAAQHVGGVTVTGSDGFDVVAPAAYVEIDGFVFTHAAGRTQIRPGRHIFIFSTTSSKPLETGLT